MAEDFNVEARFSANSKAYVQAIDAAIKANIELGESIGLSGRQIDAQDKKLNDVRKGVTGSTNDTRAQENAVKKQSRAWDQQNRIYDDYLRHQEKATGAQGEFNKAISDNEGNLARTRYALYDVAASYAAISAATLGAVAATGALAIQYESAFTGVERTTLDTAGNVSSNINQIKEDLLDLSEVLPVSFEEITRIATLGAQLGIAEGDLAAFADTVSKFSAATNVTVDAAAQAFGALGELTNTTADQFDNLGASIALVGVNSVATESEILSVATQIAGVAANAGLGAKDIVGLAGALASLRIPAEQSRGALTRVFQQINRAVARGGDELQGFADILGITSTEAAALFEADPTAFFNRFLDGLAATENLTLALDDLGLSELRVTNTLTRLSRNMDLVRSTQEDANRGFEEGTFLNDAFATVLDDVASQFQLLLNVVGRFLATSGQPMLEFLRVVLPALTSVVSELTEFADTAGGQQFFRFLGFVTAAIGVFTAFRAVIALTTASTFALVTATQVLGGTGLIANVRAMAGAVAGIGTSAGAATTTVGLLRAAIGKLFQATVVLALVAAGFDLIFTGGQGTTDVINNLAAAFLTSLGGAIDIQIAINDWFSEIASTILTVTYNIERTFPALAGMFDFVQSVGLAALRAADAFRAMWGESARGATLNRINGSKGRGVGPKGRASAGAQVDFSESTNSAEEFATALEGVGGAAGGAGREVRTLVDYANDLSSVFGRSFDIRFGSQLAVDEVADSWEKLADRIREASIALQGLEADRDIKEYFLSVAEAYGDELRANKLRAEISEINEEIADTQADASTELTGNTKAARNNRKTVTDLAKGYQDYITALAAGGADQATLNAAVAKSEAEFRAQAAALGFADAELQPYIASFRDMRTIIGLIPRNITVSANADPAIQAFREYEAAAKAAASAGRGVGNIPVGNSRGARQKAIEARIIALEAYIKNLARSGNGAGAVKVGDQIARLQSQLLNGNFYSGGYTGRGGKYEPAGIVHKGEYVVPKSQVNQSTGLPYADALGRQQVGSRPSSGGYANGGFVNGSMGVMELGPKSLGVLRQAVAKEVAVYLGDMEVAQAANRGNRQIVAMGGRP